ncbi:hypothetical protein MMC13_003317 [Lambiella insularis]|nr:hypothetical protein [Lambiella insularis]
MACQNPSHGYNPPQQPDSQPRTAAYAYPHFPNPSPAAPYFSAGLDYLHHRIGVLETELAQALADKVAAEYTAQYVLRLMAAADRQKQTNSLNGAGETPGLHQEICRLKSENATLRDRIREARPCVPMDNKSARQMAPTSSTLVDLMDHEDELAADVCDASINSEDDLEELNDYAQAPPRLDLATNGKTYRQKAEPSFEVLIEEPCRPLIQRFRDNHAQDFMRSKLAVPSQKEHCYMVSQSSAPTVPKGKEAHCFNQAPAHQVYSNPTNRYPLDIHNTFEAHRRGTAGTSKAPGGQRLHSVDTPDDSFGDSDDADQLRTIVADGLAIDWNTDVHCGREPSNATSIDVTCGPGKLFSTEVEREKIIREHKYSAGSTDNAFPDLFRYGLQYKPGPGQTNTFQTLSISNLPVDVSLNELMSRLRGGMVVSCQLLNTYSITGSHSALVRFLHEREALAYADFASANPIMFHRQRAHVSVVQTPSWPLSFRLYKAMFEHQHTRSLEVRNYPRAIPPTQLARDLRVSRGTYGNAIEHMQMRKDGVLELRFSSIFHAGKAFGVLSTWRAYRSCRITFAKDPCTLPLETLKEYDPTSTVAAKQMSKLTGRAEDDPIASKTPNLLSMMNCDQVTPSTSASELVGNTLVQSIWATPVSSQLGITYDEKALLREVPTRTNAGLDGVPEDVDVGEYLSANSTG